MTDTANQAKLASAGGLGDAADFDARLKAADENRWLATRYAPQAERERLTALYLLHHELQRALAASEPMLGKIRVQWWRETMEGVAGAGPVRRHDLALELARTLAGRADLTPLIADLLDRFDDALDDHLHGTGHDHGSAHEARHIAAEAAITVLAGAALSAELNAADRDALARAGEAHIALTAGLPDAEARLAAARKATAGLSAAQWPAIAHVAARGGSPLARRWRVFRAVLTKRL